MGLRLDQTKGAFFDAKPVKRAVDKTTRRVLSRFGAYVRTRARQSIRKRKKPSAPGQPPSSHTGTLKRLILFAYEAARKNLIAGPLLAETGGPHKPAGATVPEVLEYGGSILISEFQRDHTPASRRILESQGVDPDAWIRVRKRWPSRTKARRRRSVAIAARPTMRLAFEAERPKLPSMWADSIK